MFHSSDCNPIRANFLNWDKRTTKVELDVEVNFTVTAACLGKKLVEMTL